MSEAVIVAIISGGLALIGSIISANLQSQKVMEGVKINQAVTNTKIENLAAEVREHNNFAKRMPVVEEQIKVINHRIEDLEKKVG